MFSHRALSLVLWLALSGQAAVILDSCCSKFPSSLLGKKGSWARDLGPGRRAHLGHFHLPQSRGWLWLFQITAYTPIKQGCHTCPWTPFSVPTLSPPVTQSCCALHKRPGTRGFHNLTPLFTFAEWDSIRSQHRGHVAMALRARLASPP